MRILFICGCLEPGRDGVGDYIRRLASELIRQGHSAAALSLNDKYIIDKLNGVQQNECFDIPVLRLPGILHIKERISFARKYINEFDPDWLSLQFVIFAYNPKGLPFGLAKQLASLGKGRRWHIMFHELWVGMDENASKRLKIWGKVQQLVIKSLIAKLKPLIIHTQTSLYQQELDALGFQSQYLPLFSNIPKDNFNNNGINKNKTSLSVDLLNFVLFGHIHPGAPINDFTNDVFIYASKTGYEISLTIIGRCGSEQELWLNAWNLKGLKVNIMGEQPVNCISKILDTATFGISTTPFLLLEKSGSVAAMHEHGLPVICVSYPWQPKKGKILNSINGVTAYQRGNLETILNNKLLLDFKESRNISIITQQLVNAYLTSF